MEKYGFPILSFEAIQTILAEMGQHIEKDDISTKPNWARLRPIYEFFLEACLYIPKDEYFPAPEFIDGSIEVGEVDAEALELLAFLYRLGCLAEIAGINDFAIRDSIKPEPGRIRKILSGIINFARFQTGRQPLFDELEAKLLDAREAVEKAAEEQNELCKVVSALELERKEQEPELKRLKEANNSLTVDLKEQKKLNTPLVNEIESLKQNKDEITHKLSNIAYATVNLKQEIERLKMRKLPQDPEKLKLSIENMNESVKKEQELASLQDRKQRDVKRRLDLAISLHEKAKSCEQSIEEAENEIKKCDNDKQANQELSQKLESRGLELSNLQAELERLRIQETNNREKLDHYLEQAKERLQELEEKWAESENAYQKLKGEDLENDEKKCHEQRVIEELEHKIASLHKAEEKNLIEMTNRRNEFENQAKFRLLNLMYKMDNM
ncbi:13372_t:CDS:10 [Ambispora leptoticha]|uniref:13372_t:CDS:1 n=1 Tax=Ambispora leptoticha TaxID=144679 RepID=A0A9N8VE29_9GLOM|nr:13372_t:CDS:10 [Ambispora leptoticha]